MRDDVAIYRLMRGGTLLMVPAVLDRLRTQLPAGAELEATPAEGGYLDVRASATAEVPEPPIDPERTIDYGRYRLRRPWPADCHVQGGGHGLVLGESPYTTAFFEAFPTVPATFIRGEGATLEEAEEAAWAKYTRVSGGDHTHDYEARGYRNGAGVCRICDLFTSDVFTPEQVGCFCSVCGTPTFWMQIGDVIFCKNHEVSFEERQRLRAEARAQGKQVSQVGEMFDDLVQFLNGHLEEAP